MSKRFLCIVFALMLIFTSMDMSVFAEEAGGSVSENEAEIIESTEVVLSENEIEDETEEIEQPECSGEEDETILEMAENLGVTECENHSDMLVKEENIIMSSSYEYAMFPMKCLNITQGEYGTYSHQGIRAIDNAGSDSGQDPFFAPFSGKVVRKGFGSDSNNVIIESLNPVQWADGTIDYAHIWMAHDEDISDLYEGKTFSQGTEIYREGQKGEATGNHVHFVCGKGKYSGLLQVSSGKWTVENEVSAYNLFYLPNDTYVKNGYGYTWRSMTFYNDPIGNLDYITGMTGQVYMNGWALDKDLPTTPVEIHVYIGSGNERKCYATFGADI